ncbi:hypothetical protein NDU88_006405 [Pleurodeles waltl]|uniref:Uncharacterized protein n=1 Tax=Pleurodeles waltl TaxID=8319 RepID=A0AAV7ULU2_PLEWA|nr:hypothetical protein NDU88_006405 [Pleurodeles waltl]
MRAGAKTIRTRKNGSYSITAGRSMNARFNSEGTEAPNRPPESTYFSLVLIMPDDLRLLWLPGTRESVRNGGHKKRGRQQTWRKDLKKTRKGRQYCVSHL